MGQEVADDVIRNTLPRTKEATWGLYVPSPDPTKHGVPTLSGTCFMVDPTGYLVTASHVVTDDTGTELAIVSLQRPATSELGFVPMLQSVSIVARWPEVDIALLKADFRANANKAWLNGRTEFPYLPVSFDIPEDGTPVYSYGFPLPPETKVYDAGGAIVAFGGLRPRTTSAIIASGVETIAAVRTSTDPRFLVTDKAFNYGNSGGPLVMQETGQAAGVVVRFQPVGIPQSGGQAVVVPSLYGIASAVANIRSDIEATIPIFGESN